MTSFLCLWVLIRSMVDKRNLVSRNSFIYAAKTVATLFLSIVVFTTVVIPVILLLFVLTSMIASMMVWYVILSRAFATRSDDSYDAHQDSRFRQEVHNKGVEAERGNGRLDHLKRLYRDGDISREKFEQLISDEIEVTESNKIREKDKI